MLPLEVFEILSLSVMEKAASTEGISLINHLVVVELLRNDTKTIAVLINLLVVYSSK